MLDDFDRNQILWAIGMNFKDWNCFKHCFAIRYILAMIRDMKRNAGKQSKEHGRRPTDKDMAK
mgnify:CR=1 FL=1